MSTEISRREFLARTGAAAMTLPFLNIGSAFGAEERPNFLFILTDDQRWDAMSCMGNPFAITPNIDRLAKEGARFANAFVTTSLCSPSRASFLTGRYAHSHGVKNNITKFDPKMPTFGSELQKAGYDTAWMGKWHMATDGSPEPGFTKWVSFFDQGQYWNPTFNIDGKTEKRTGYMTDLLTDYAVDWLKQPRKAPFCLTIAHKAVHGEFAPATRHLNCLSDIQPKRPPSMDEPTQGKPQCVNRMRDTWSTPESRERIRDKVQNYYRTLMAVDDSVGRVLETLESTGALDNTVIVFCSDNGYFLGEHGLGDKRAMYEESIRIPFLMRYPKLIKPGRVVPQMVLNVDLCPTFLDMAGVKAPAEVEGQSFRPLLDHTSDSWRKDFLYEYFWEAEAKKRPPIQGIRTAKWKYITYPDGINCSELYDLNKDPLEMHNVIDVSANAQVLAEMKELLNKRLDEAAGK